MQPGAELKNPRSGPGSERRDLTEIGVVDVAIR